MTPPRGLEGYADGGQIEQAMAGISEPTQAMEPDVELANRLERERNEHLQACAVHRDQAGHHNLEADRYERMAASLAAALEALLPQPKVVVPPRDWQQQSQQQIGRPVTDRPQA